RNPAPTELKINHEGLFAVAFSRDDLVLYACGGDDQLAFVDLARGVIRRTPLGLKQSDLLTLLADGRLLVAHRTGALTVVECRPWEEAGAGEYGKPVGRIPSGNAGW